MKYTFEEIDYCRDMICIYQVYKVNSYWKYEGIIVTNFLNEFIIRCKDGHGGEIVSCKNILSIPLYDACKGSSMLKLVLGDVNG